MEFYSKIYSCYYKVIRKILNRTLKEPLTKKEIKEVIDREAFSESAFYIIPKLIDGEWNLMENIGGRYKSKLNCNVNRPVTSLEKSWLKSLLLDRRANLFLRSDQILYLEKVLKDIEPMFDPSDFHYYDTFLDGDPYESNKYIDNFRRILKAIKEKIIITISYESGRDKPVIGKFLPIKIEYSSKDDKFRLHAVRIRYKKVVKETIINIARITNIAECQEKFMEEIDYHKQSSKNKCNEPVIIEISKERNAVERCMLHFASYEKSTEYDEENDKYISYIYYDKRDEAELLVRILSFGPVIKVLGPERFLNQVRERVASQWKFLKDNGSN
ncbi:MAG: WYL domain-containing protein [Bacillota bacterium]|nr:WYL domain-containing protein [Bacillota bacterium]